MVSWWFSPSIMGRHGSGNSSIHVGVHMTQLVTSWLPWFTWEISSTSSCIWMLSSKWRSCWRNFRNAALLEEIDHCELTVRSHSLTPSRALSLLSACPWGCELSAFCSGHHACLLWRVLIPQQPLSPNKPCLLQVASVSVFYHSNRKASDTMTDRKQSTGQGRRQSQ